MYDCTVIIFENPFFCISLDLHVIKDNVQLKHINFNTQYRICVYNPHSLKMTHRLFLIRYTWKQIFHLYNTFFVHFCFSVFRTNSFFLNHPSVSLPFSFNVCFCDLFLSYVLFSCLESCFVVVFKGCIKSFNI